MTVRPIEILLVEDNPGDVRLTLEALKDSRISSTLRVVNDGAEAIQYLRQQGKYTKATIPDLVLLDLNLPKKDGREVLAEVKADKNLKRIPVVILTSSKCEEDILKAYGLHANCYITKPLDLEQYHKVVSSVEDFWLTRVSLPTRAGQDT